MRAQWVVLLVFATSCAATSSAVGAAVINTAVAGAVSAHERSEGRCYTPCTEGTRCNPTTGYCDTIPCRGKCRDTERCDASAMFEKCVPMEPELKIETKLTPR